MAVEPVYRLAARIMSLGFEDPGMDPDAIAVMLVQDRRTVALEVLGDLEWELAGLTVGEREPLKVALEKIRSLYQASNESPSKPADAKDPAAVQLGRKGGLKGGKARSKALTPEQRSASAKKAARARWR